MRSRPRSKAIHRRRFRAAVAALAVGVVALLAGCGGSSGGGESSTTAATGEGSSTTAQAQPSTSTGTSTTTTKGGSTSSSGTSTGSTTASKPNGATSSTGLPSKPGPAEKIKGCLTAGKASVTYTPKAHGYGALLATGPSGGQLMIIAAPTAASATAFIHEFKPSQPVSVQRSNGGKTITIQAKNAASADRSLAQKCAGEH